MSPAGAVVTLAVVAALVRPGPNRPAARPAVRTVPRRPLRARRRTGVATTAAELAELFAAALESGLDPLSATRWCARRTATRAGGDDVVLATSSTDRAVPRESPGDLGPPTDPVLWWGDRVPAVARALAVAGRLGSPAAPAVRIAAEAERERARAEADLRSGLAGVRVTAWLLTALPALGAVLAATTTAPSGPALVAMAAGTALTASGWWLLRVLVGRVSRGART